MFLREAVQRCAELEESIAAIYDNLALQHQGRGDLAILWSELSHRERTRARVLRAASAAEDVLENDGPFLVHVPLQLAGLRRVVDTASRRIQAGVEPSAALDVVESIEAADRGGIYTGLLELIRPEIAKVLRVVDSQSTRRGADETLLVKLREAATHVGAGF